MIKSASHSRGLNDRDVEDNLHNLRNENLELKKKVNSQDSKTKVLLTKVQRLSEDLMKTKEQGSGSQQSKQREIRNNDDSDELIKELRSQVRDLTKENSQTRAKMHYFRALHEAESRKRTPYDHIPPRLNTTPQRRKLYPAVNVQGRRSASANHTRSSSAEPTHHHNSSDLEKMEELVAVLRTKLTEAEHTMENLRNEHRRNDEDRVRQLQDADIERAALQMELATLKKADRDLRAKMESLTSKVKSMEQVHQDALQVSEDLNEELKEERRRNVDLEHEIKKLEIARKTNQELMDMIEDLREEKRILEEEQENLLSAQFGRDREEDYQREIDKLRAKLREHANELDSHLGEKANLHSDYQDLKDRYRDLLHDKEESDKHKYEIMEELENLRDKLKFLSQNGDVDLSEIEEALSLVRLRRERGISLDFLLEAEELYADKKLLQDLRVQYADCIHELEKTRKLLTLQEHINRDYKLEVEDLNRKLEAMKNGYELRLEEDARLLDLRAIKIANLEAQLKSIIYGTTKIPTDSRDLSSDSEDDIELLNGQNLIEVHLEAALISDEGLNVLRKIGIDWGDPSALTTFAHFDFFEFETDVSPIGLGQKPVFNSTSRYKVFTDDFFLQYLQSQSITLHFCICNGIDFLTIATCPMVMKELTEPNKTEHLRYYADLVSTHDGRTIIGKMDYGLRVRLPMAQAIRSFKERTVALNLLTVGDKSQSSGRFKSRAESNDLAIRIIQCFNLHPPHGRIPAVFATFQFYVHADIVTDTVANSKDPLLNYLRVLPLPMTSDLDRYLRTSTLKIIVMDDNEGVNDFVYGICKVPLLSLALGDTIEGEYPLEDEYGISRSTITLSLRWTKEFKPSIRPRVSDVLDRDHDSDDTSESSRHSHSTSSESEDHSRYPEHRNYKSNKRPDSDTSDSQSQNTSQRSSTEFSKDESQDSNTNTYNSKNNSDAASSKRSAKASSSMESLDRGPQRRVLEPQRNSSFMSERSNASSVPKRIIPNSQMKAMKPSRSYGSDDSEAASEHEQKTGQQMKKNHSDSLSSIDDDIISTPHTSQGKRSNDSLSEGHDEKNNRKGKDKQKNYDEGHDDEDDIRDSRATLASQFASNNTLSTNSSQHASNSSMASNQHESKQSIASNNQSTTSLDSRQQSKADLSSMPSETSLAHKGSTKSLATAASESNLTEHPSTSTLAHSSSNTLASHTSTNTLSAHPSNITLESSNSRSAASLHESNVSGSLESSNRLGGSSQTVGDSMQSVSTSRDTIVASRDGLADSRGSLASSNRSLARSNEALNERDEPQRRDMSSHESLDDSRQDLTHNRQQRAKRKEDSRLRVAITKLVVDWDDNSVRRLLEQTKQVFVSYEFLDFPAEELETHSVYLEKSGKMKISYSKLFNFESNKAKQSLKQALLSSRHKGSCIIFTLVSEPTEVEDDGTTECRDIAFGSLDLADLADSGTNETSTVLPLQDPSDETIIARLHVTIIGCEFLKELIN